MTGASNRQDMYLEQDTSQQMLIGERREQPFTELQIKDCDDWKADA